MLGLLVVVSVYVSLVAIFDGLFLTPLTASYLLPLRGVRVIMGCACLMGSWRTSPAPILCPFFIAPVTCRFRDRASNFPQWY